MTVEAAMIQPCWAMGRQRQEAALFIQSRYHSLRQLSKVLQALSFWIGSPGASKNQKAKVLGIGVDTVLRLSELLFIFLIFLIKKAQPLHFFFSNS